MAHVGGGVYCSRRSEPRWVLRATLAVYASRLFHSKSDKPSVSTLCSKEERGSEGERTSESMGASERERAREKQARHKLVYATVESLATVETGTRVSTCPILVSECVRVCNIYIYIYANVCVCVCVCVCEYKQVSGTISVCARQLFLGSSMQSLSQASPSNSTRHAPLQRGSI